MEVRDLYNKIDQMLRDIEKAEVELEEAFTKAIYDAANENPNKPRSISKNMFMVRFSDMIGKPWNTEFYQWEASADILLSYLKKSHVKHWKKLLEDIYSKRSGECAFVPKKVKIWYNMYRTEKTTIPADFVKRIIDKL